MTNEEIAREIFKIDKSINLNDATNYIENEMEKRGYWYTIQCKDDKSRLKYFFSKGPVETLTPSHIPYFVFDALMELLSSCNEL